MKDEITSDNIGSSSIETIDQAIIETDSREKGERVLPTHVIVALVIALNLCSTESIVDVFKNLVAGLAAQ